MVGQKKQGFMALKLESRTCEVAAEHRGVDRALLCSSKITSLLPLISLQQRRDDRTEASFTLFHTLVVSYRVAIEKIG